MNKILFDFSYYQLGDTFHGGGEYGNVILERLLSDKRLIGGVFYYVQRPIHSDMFERIKQEENWQIHPIVDLRGITKIIKEHNYTVVYSPLPYNKTWGLVRIPKEVGFIGTYHGLREIELAKMSKEEQSYYNGDDEVVAKYIFDVTEDNTFKVIEKYGKSLTAHENKIIITDSEHSKAMMQFYFPQLDADRIKVLYAPPKISEYINDDIFEGRILEEYGVKKENYALVVSAGIYYKNALRVIKAYDRLFDRCLPIVPNDYKVVVLGVKGQEKYISSVKHSYRFVFESYVESDALEVFYKNAHLFLYPSLNEGFGYPPIEAMKYGTICACSVNTSIPEVCQNMAFLFNPLMIDEICSRIIQSFSMPLREKKKLIIKNEYEKVAKRQRDDLDELIKLITEG